jgi:hypothetical protein
MPASTGQGGKRGNIKINKSLEHKGLISADRGTKATLMLTIPGSLFKSYAKDLSLPIFELVIQHRLPAPFVARQVPLQCYDLGCGRPTPILIRYIIKESNVSPLIQHGFWLRGVQP